MSLSIDLSTDVTIALSQLKNFLKINDAEKDDVLKELIVDAQHDSLSKIFPFSEELPLTGFLLTLLQKAQFHYVVSCWKDKQNNEKAAEKFMKKYESKMELLVNALKSIPTDRTDTVVVSSDYKSEPLRSRERFFD